MILRKDYLFAVIVFLEISGKWPDDLEAVQAVKAEFHSKMSDILKQDNITTVLFPQFLQILWVLLFCFYSCCVLLDLLILLTKL